MIERVVSETKSICLNEDIKRIEFYKHETGNIDIFKVYGPDNQLKAYQGFFKGNYHIDHVPESNEQLSIFDF